MTVSLNKDIVAGLTVAGAGALTSIYSASTYAVGTAGRMGPGYFPFVLGCILAVLGVAIVLIHLRTGAEATEPRPFAARPFFTIILAVAGFAVFLEPLGFVAATMIMTTLAAFAERPFNLKRTIALGFGLAALGWLIFVLGLGMNFAAFGRGF